MLMPLCRWHAGDRSVRLFLSCHSLSLNQDHPDFRGCVLNKRKWSKWSDKSRRGKRSVLVTKWCGMGTRDSTEALMEATRSVVSAGGVCWVRSLKTVGSLIFLARCARHSYPRRPVTSLIIEVHFPAAAIPDNSLL